MGGLFFPLMLAVLLLSACVTDEKTIKPIGGGGRGVPVRADPAKPATLPDGPIARPVTAGSVSSSVRVEVLPLGSVAYDGQVLPLVSPDGRFAAVQQGEAPSWQAILAADHASPPMRTRLARFDITGREPRRLDGEVDLPPGLLLGRSADTRGFLVEAPQPDGSRWIGKVAWVSGALSWLVRDGSVNAHAFLTRGGELLFSCHQAGKPEARLVLLDESGRRQEWGRPGESWLMPAAASDEDRVYSLVAGGEGLGLAAVLLDRSAEGPRFSGIAWSVRLFNEFQPAVPYQMLAATPPAWQGPVQNGWREPLLIYHPVQDRMIRVDAVTGAFDPLPRRSVAASHSALADSPGWFSSTPQGLVFTPAGAGTDATPVRVLGDAYIPRATSDASRPFILIGPVPREPNRLRLMAMMLP